MNQKYLHLSVLLDESGSMANKAHDTIIHFNKFVDDQANEEGKFTLSVSSFNVDYKQLASFSLESKDSRSFILSKSNYNPNWGTALYDALEQSIRETGEALASLPEEERPAKVMVLVITDGEENSSRRINYLQLRDLIEQQENIYKWEILFVGSSKEGIKQAQDLGIKSSKVAFYTDGTEDQMLGVVCGSMSSYRRTAASCVTGEYIPEFKFDNDKLS